MTLLNNRYPKKDFMRYCHGRIPTKQRARRIALYYASLAFHNGHRAAYYYLAMAAGAIYHGAVAPKDLGWQLKRRQT